MFTYFSSRHPSAPPPSPPPPHPLLPVPNTPYGFCGREAPCSLTSSADAKQHACHVVSPGLPDVQGQGAEPLRAHGADLQHHVATGDYHVQLPDRDLLVPLQLRHGGRGCRLREGRHHSGCLDGQEGLSLAKVKGGVGR